MQLAARLALYTGNQTYLDWAHSVMDWSINSGLVAQNGARIYDGFDTTTNCSQINHIQWSSSAGTYLSGSAYAYNHVSIHSSHPVSYTHLTLPTKRIV